MADRNQISLSLPGPSPDRLFWTALTILAAARMIYNFILPLDLVGDEAYYWDWGRHPAWGYFSKPPLIAWLMALATRLGGDTVLAIRTAALLFGTGTLVLAHRLARDLYGPQIACWAVAAMAFTPGNAGANIIFTIDAPLLFFWCASLLCLWRATNSGPRRALWALLLVPALGLGLLSKQMMVVFPILALFFLASDRELRRLLLRPWPWLALATAATFLVPVLLWNSRHDWITFGHTAHHFTGRSFAPLKMIGRLLAFAGGQMGLTSPLLWIPLVALLAACLVAFRRLGRSERFLFLFSGPPILVMLVMTLRQRMNGNWPAAFYPAALILLAGWAAGRFHPGMVSPKLRRWFRPGIVVGAALALVAYLGPLIIPHTGLAGGDLDPTLRLRGWQPLGQEVGRLQTEMPDPQRTFIYTLGHRYTTSQLAFFTPGHPPVYRWTNPGVIESQYELWPGPQQHDGWSGLVVIPGPNAGLPPALRRRFRKVDPPLTIRIPTGRKRHREYTIHPAHGYQGTSAEDVR